MSHTMCIANQKGGVGKTTTAINLAVGLAKSGRRSLLIDLDPQCNATSGLGVQPLPRHPLIGEAPVEDAIVAGPGDLAILPGSRHFADIEALATGTSESVEQLRRHMEDLASYEQVVIDCPPSLGQLTKTALAVSDEVMMPIQCEYFAMEGLTQMLHVIREVMREDGRLEFGGILLTMYDEMLDLTHEVDAEVRDFFGDIVFDTVIPRDVAVAEAPSHCQSVLDYAPRARGARAYIELCMEVLEYGEG